MIQNGPILNGDQTGSGFVLRRRIRAAGAQIGLSVPDRQSVLDRNQPVEITLVNRLPETTAIHWHGVELASFYDGVHGLSGDRRAAWRR